MHEQFHRFPQDPLGVKRALKSIRHELVQSLMILAAEWCHAKSFSTLLVNASSHRRFLTTVGQVEVRFNLFYSFFFTTCYDNTSFDSRHHLLAFFTRSPLDTHSPAIASTSTVAHAR